MHIKACCRKLLVRQLSPREVAGTFVGVRPLLAGKPGAASAVSREHALFETADGVLAVGGGKYTTYRAMAAEVADRVMSRLGRPCVQPLTARIPLPGGGDGWQETRHVTPAGTRRHDLDAVTLQRLTARYGARTHHLLAMLDREPQLAAPLVTGLPLLGVEVAYAADFEMARTPEDVLRRRSALALTTGHGLAALGPVARLLASRLDLPAERLDVLVATYAHRNQI